MLESLSHVSCVIDSTYWAAVAGKGEGQWTRYVSSPCSTEICELSLVMNSGMVITFISSCEHMLKGYWFVSHCASSVHQRSHQDQRKHRQCENCIGTEGSGGT